MKGTPRLTWPATPGRMNSRPRLRLLLMPLLFPSRMVFLAEATGPLRKANAKGGRTREFWIDGEYVLQPECKAGPDLSGVGQSASFRSPRPAPELRRSRKESEY